MKKNNNQLYLFVIILCLLALALGGYIVYDKSLSSNNNSDGDINYNELAKISKMDYNFINGVYNDQYSINVLSDGKIIVNFENYISNISNATDLMLFSGPGAGDIVYILTTDGDIYTYDLANVNNNNYEATKVNEYSNIKKMVRYKTRKAHAGGCDYVVLIDNDDNYYSLNSYCV